MKKGRYVLIYSHKKCIILYARWLGDVHPVHICLKKKQNKFNLNFKRMAGNVSFYNREILENAHVLK
jgi:hypothetical protein